MTVRKLRTGARVPQLLMFSLTMPMAMLVLFSQVFRSVAAGPRLPAGVSYIVFLTPAMLAVSTVMAGTNAGVSAAIDHPPACATASRPCRYGRPCRGIARTINEAVFTLARAALLGIVTVALGFEFYGTAVDAVAAAVVLVVLAGAMSALFGLIGDWLRRPDVVQFAGMMVMMALMFVSSAFAPIEWWAALARAGRLLCRRLRARTRARRTRGRQGPACPARNLIAGAGRVPARRPALHRWVRRRRCRCGIHRDRPL
ncbi:ABC transporter permease [Rhodococcus sp. T2V]|uniref:ABC transporter permease n=1 Tax=Rhodococcus sp. T2V TaxID=3034164 RepID=UPI0023E2F540|nr:ABC transporter permease [Rhodococcus sp. T2V]MDF3310692.1 ABC transporter permease [Rhodococcus sp. T2V]